MDIKKIIDELARAAIIHPEGVAYEPLKGGTVSELYLIQSGDSKYVVKSNEPHVMKAEAEFLHCYKDNELLPKLLFVEPSYKYLVYTFLPGSTCKAENNKQNMLKALVNGLLNQYKPVPSGSGWGWLDYPVDSWKSFLMDGVMEAKKIIGLRFLDEQHQFIVDLIKTIPAPKTPFLLHGDCGIHNFLFQNGELSGVIDPTPVIGDPLYDLIYAFCSSPVDLTKETIDEAARHFTLNKENHRAFLYEKVLIGLYRRLASCIKHHPEDFEHYEKAWGYWVNVVKRMRE